MKVFFYALMAMSLVSIPLNAEEVEEVVVTASFIDQNVSDIHGDQQQARYQRPDKEVTHRHCFWIEDTHR